MSVTIVHVEVLGTEFLYQLENNVQVEETEHIIRKYIICLFSYAVEASEKQ